MSLLLNEVDLLFFFSWSLQDCRASISIISKEKLLINLILR